MRNATATHLLFDQSQPGRRGLNLPACDVPERPVSELLPAGMLAAAPPPLPELTEPEVVRHFVNLSTLNMSVDTHFYPLGSCTMKYNPKRNERLASLPGLLDVHPYQPDDSMQGLLELLYRDQEMLAEIAGLPAVSLQPAAGAQGEMTALFVAAAYFRDIGQPRTTVLIPDGAHGTNPASAAMAGFQALAVKSTPRGFVDLDDLAAKLNERTAVFMITNPNTLGMFEGNIREIARRVHEVGGLVYLDGANMNAILGIARPGDFGADMMHFNPHKTFSGPHGGGGPGAGPIAVTERLAPYLPSPVVVREGEGHRETGGLAPVGSKPAVREGEGEGYRETGGLAPFRSKPAVREGEGEGYRETGGLAPFRSKPVVREGYRLDDDRPKSIGRVRAFFGNTGVLVRMYCYIRTHGPAGLREVSENAVLNANYLLSRVQDFLPVPQGNRCMHEFVASASRLAAERHISAMDIGKRLLDFGFHAPTVYFPLIVREALMIEPTESESKATLDAFAETLRQIVEEPQDLLHGAPHTTAICRPDEVRAARQPVLRWSPASE